MMSLFDYTEDSWTLETTIGGGFTGFMFADNDGQMSAKTSVILFYHFTIYDLTTKGKKKWTIRHFDYVRFDEK